MCSHGQHRISTAVEVADHWDLSGRAQHQTASEVDEKTWSHVEQRASRVVVECALGIHTVALGVPEVQLHDPVEPPAELVLVGPVGEHATPVAVAEIVVARVPVRRRDRR
jgi:hypothetical protein